jgi:hypothetical protein
MITGAHVLLYSTNPEADREFLSDVLDLRSVDVGRGWLIFKLPPAELAVHPGDGSFSQSHSGHAMLGALVYLMCDDIEETAAELTRKGARCTAMSREAWGIKTTVRLPSGGEIGLYQPTHQTALSL